MKKTPVLNFLLGALSPSGFSGWFAEAAAEPGAKPRLIKAGPGCGKSTFMRKIGEAAAAKAPSGAVIEQIHCSSDPGSLDGVRLPDGTLYLDATAPHTLDCKYPGAVERVVSFYDTLDNDSLEQHSAEVLALGNQNSELLQRAAADFALACGLLQRRRQYAAQTVDTEKLNRFTARLAARLMPRRSGSKPGSPAHPAAQCAHARRHYSLCRYCDKAGRYHLCSARCLRCCVRPHDETARRPRAPGGV